MRQVSLTIGHNVGDEPRYTTPEVAMAVHTILGVQVYAVEEAMNDLYGVDLAAAILAEED